MWVMQANYGFGHGWEDECVEPSKAGALERLAEYEENAGQYSYRIAAILAVLQIWLDKAEEE